MSKVFSILLSILSNLRRSTLQRLILTTLVVITSGYIDYFFLIILKLLISPLNSFNELDLALNSIYVPFSPFPFSSFSIPVTLQQVSITVLPLSAILFALRVKIYSFISRISVLIARDISEVAVQSFISNPYAINHSLLDTSVVSVLFTDIQRLVSTFVLPIFLLFQSLITLIVSVSILFGASFFKTLILIALFACFYFSTAYLSSSKQKSLSKQISFYQSQCMNLVSSIFNNIQYLNRLPRDNSISSLYSHYMFKSLWAQTSIGIFSNAPRFGIESLIICSIALLLLLSNDLQESFAYLSVLAIAIPRALPAMQQFYRTYATLVSSRTQLTNLFRILSLSSSPPYDTDKLSLDFNYNNVLIIELKNTLTNTAIYYSEDYIPANFLHYKILGQSGCGKSTLMESLIGLNHLGEGRILLPSSLTSDSLNTMMITRSCSLLPASMTINLFPQYHPDKKIPKPKLLEAAQLLKILSIPAELGSHYETIKSLSSGQVARVLLIRALMEKPTILILDELIDSLDSVTEQIVYDLFQQYLKYSLILSITHKSYDSGYFKSLPLSQ